MGVSPKAEHAEGEVDAEGPLAEVDSLQGLRWSSVAERFALQPGTSVFNLHNVSLAYQPLLCDLRRAGVPYVLTSHGQLGFQTAWRWLKKFVYLNFVNRDLHQAAGLHVLTKFAASRVTWLLPGFCGNILVQGNLLETPNLLALPPATRSEYGLPNDAFVLMFLGRLDVPVKGLDLVVEAFSRLPPDRTRLLLVGPDWQGGKAKLEKLAERLGCRDRVHFPGPAYGEKKWSLLKMADVFVSPSRREAFSIAQAEAMATGLPVVTSTSANLASELREANAALVSPLAAEPLAGAIAALEADGERRRALGNRGKVWAEESCDSDLAGLRFREFYQTILNQARSATK